MPSPVFLSRCQALWRTFLSLQQETGSNALTWTEGWRAALGMSVPIAIGLLMNHLAWGILAGFAVLWIVSCDLGGAYRQKAINLTGSALVIVICYLFSIWMTWSHLNYVLGTFVWVFLAALLGVSGSAAAQVGLVTSTIVISSVMLIAPGEYLNRLFACLLGMAWALFLCLALWPLRAYSPAFEALVKSCTKLSDLAENVWSGATTPERPPTNIQFALAYDTLMSSLEKTRETWGAVRARRPGASTRSMQLLLLIEQIDDLGRTLVNLREIINLVGKEPWFQECRPALQKLTQICAQLGQETSQVIAARKGEVSTAGVQKLSREISDRLSLHSAEDSVASFHSKELARTIKHFVEQFLVLSAIASELDSDKPTVQQPPEARFGPRPRTFHPWNEIRNSLSFRSRSFRHALRLGLSTAGAALLVTTLHISRGYWIPMTMVLLLKPNFGGTLQRSAQRITGTLLGALLAALLVLLFRNEWLLVSWVAVLAFTTFALRNCNYGLFVLSLTPLVMLMLDLAHPGTVTDSFLRILNTFFGCLLALLSGYLLFPLWESRQFPRDIAAAFRADSDFLRAFGDLVRGREKRPMAEFRRAAAVAVSNARMAAERLLAEPTSRRGDVEASLAGVNYCRQALLALAALSDYPAREPVRLQSGASGDLLLALIDTLSDGLDALAEALETGAEPKPLIALANLTNELEDSVRSKSPGAPVPGPESDTYKKDETVAWLFYHLHNISDLTLNAREVVVRLLRAENPPQQSSAVLVHQR